MDFAIALSRTCEVTVVAPSLSSAGNHSIGSISIRNYRVPSLPLSLLKPNNPLSILKILQTLNSGLKTLRKTVEHLRPDHILAMWSLPCGYWAANASAGTGIPFSTWSLGSDIWSMGRIPVVSSVLKSVLRAGEHRFADGYELCSDVESICKLPCSFLPSTRMLNLPHSAPPEREVPPFRLAFLGRWHVNKGIDLLLEALEKLDEDVWNRIELFSIYGGGPMEKLVHQRSRLLIEDGKPLKVGGYLNHQEAVALYMNSDFLVIPSRIESIPLVFSDALQCSLPVVTTPVGDMPQILNSFACGILADDTSADSIAQAIKQAVYHKQTSFLPGIALANKSFSTEAACETFLSAITSSANYPARE